MSTPMIDFERNDIISIVRIHYPLSGIGTSISLHDKERLTITCTDEDHEKLVADYLAWKDAKDKTKCSLGADNLSNEIIARDYENGLPTPKQTPPMPKPFDDAAIARHLEDKLLNPAKKRNIHDILLDFCGSDAEIVLTERRPNKLVAKIECARLLDDGSILFRFIINDSINGVIDIKMGEMVEIHGGSNSISMNGKLFHHRFCGFNYRLNRS